MNPRLSRPLLAIAISGALVAGGAVVASPAFADSTGARESSSDARTALAEDPPAPDPTDPTTEPTPEPSSPTPEPPTPTPSSPTPEPTETTTAPTTDPTTSEPTPDPTETTTAPTTEPTADPTESSEGPDTVAPTGKFSLNTNALWIGQSITMTQGVVEDDQSSPSEISRMVNWGDGTSSTLVAGQAPIKKRYTKNGRFTITFTLTDAAGNSGPATAPSATVAVSTPGKFKLSKSSVWNGESFKITFSSVPAGTTKLTLDWGDGYVDNIKPKNQTVSGYYYHRKNAGLVKGAVTLRATFTNKFGASSAIYVGKVTVKKDSWKPVVKVKKPANSNRLKSWKYVYGTVSDKGSGTPYVFVWASRITGNKVYCFTPKKTWKRVYTEEQFNNCAPIMVKIAKGKWSLKLSGLKKGTLYVDAKTWDWADNASRWASVKAKITRS